MVCVKKATIESQIGKSEEESKPLQEMRDQWRSSVCHCTRLFCEPERSRGTECRSFDSDACCPHQYGSEMQVSDVSRDCWHKPPRSCLAFRFISCIPNLTLFRRERPPHLTRSEPDSGLSRLALDQGSHLLHWISEEVVS